MFIRKLLTAIIVLGSFIITASEATKEETIKKPNILLVGFIPGEFTSENVPERLQFTQMPNVHCLDRWPPSHYSAGTITPFYCTYHQVDWMKKEQWDNFVNQNQRKFDVVIFDQRVAHHFAGIDNFQSFKKLKISDSDLTIHSNFAEILSDFGRVYIPIFESRSPEGEEISVNTSELFVQYINRIREHFAAAGLMQVCEFINDQVKPVLLKSATLKVLEIDYEDLEILRSFLGSHPCLQVFINPKDDQDSESLVRQNFVLWKFEKMNFVQKVVGE